MSDGPASSRQRALRVGVVVVALLAFAGVMVLANFGGTAPPVPQDADDAPAAAQRGKARARGKPGDLRPDEDLWVEGPAVARPAAPEGAPNVVVVLMTAVRRDALEPYGAIAGRSPTLAQLAARGARFGDAIAAAPHPRGAEIALLTGQHAAALGLTDPGPGPENRPLPDGVATLAERLQAAGWATVGVTANHNLNAGTGLARGFDRYREAQDQSFRPAGRIEAPRVVREGVAGLDALPEALEGRPFYLQLAMVDAHSPLRRVPALEAELDRDLPNVAYRVAVRRIDEALRQLVDELDARGHAVGEDTFLVVVSEHGEGNDDPPHHGRFHGHLLYETSVGIPWIVVGPGVIPGRVIGGLASQTDFAPTVLGLLGLPTPDGIDGRSWAPQLRGEADRTDRERAFSDTWFFGTNRAAIWTPTAACQKDFGSLPADGGGSFADGCYDRAVDPEFRNLKQDPALLAELEAWRASVSGGAAPAAAGDGDGAPAEGAAGGGDPPEPEAAG